MNAPDPALDPVRRAAAPLRGLDDVEALVNLVGDARLVLLGEATHGTHEFYALRAALSLRLIEAHGFDAIAVEADWPDALRLSRWVQGASEDADAPAALSGFTRFPRWMWRNREIVALAEGLRAHNASQPPERRAGFYGLDLYSLSGSVQAVLDYLGAHDPEMARAARERYGCFGHLLHDPQRYAHATHFGLSDDCQRQALQQLQALVGSAAQHLRNDGLAAADELFYAQQNALVVRNAERYYRTMFQGSTASWNLRDRHMAQVLQQLRDHLSRQRGRAARIVVWAHNSHIGDARATEMGADGQLNLGQLVREAADGDCCLLGFSTDHGSVAAADDWDAPVQFKRVRPAREDSWEGLMHRAGLPLFLLPLREGDLRTRLAPPRLERAIGVIYRPETERVSHYFEAALSQQFDALIHVDRSHAVRPLDSAGAPEHTEPETFPSGL